MSEQLNDYFFALERLKSNSPINVPKGTKISNDTISLEAGRKKGSIKKSRAIFSDLILEIEKAKKEASKPSKTNDETLLEQKNKVEIYKSLLDESLAREVSLIHEVYELKRELAKLGGSNVINLGRA